MKKTKALAAVLAAALVLTGCTPDENVSGAADVSEEAGRSETSGEAESTQSSESSGKNKYEGMEPTLKPHGDKTINSFPAQSTSSDPESTEETSETLTEETLEAELYIVEENVYSMKKPEPDAETVNSYTRGEPISVKAKTDNGYYRLGDGSFILMEYAGSEMPQ